MRPIFLDGRIVANPEVDLQGRLSEIAPKDGLARWDGGGVLGDEES